MYQDSIPLFISEPSDLFYLKIEQMDWTRFERMTGYDLWYRRLGHTPNKLNCRLNIQLDLRRLMERNSASIRNVHHAWLVNHGLMTNQNQSSGQRSHLQRWTFDLIASSVTSIEGYNYCAVFTDDCSDYRWAYGLKTKDELIDVVKQWYAEIADLREKYQLLVVMRDFAGKNMCHEIQ